MKTNIGFIGFGHMAQVIFQALDFARFVPRSQVLFVQRDSHKIRQNEKKFGITSTSLKTLIEKSDLIILGVRPNQAEIVLKDLGDLQIDESKMIVSVVAGLKLVFYRKFIKNPILRVMPNVASQVGMGMSVFSFIEGASSEFKSLSKLLFSCMGEVMEVPEGLMDISCGIAGSGPGFVFRLLHSAAQAGEKEGLCYEQALQMAAQTFMGAAKLVMKKKQIDSLLNAIATPNGTTEAGLKKMDELNIGDHFQKVILASSQRSKELSQTN